MINKFIFALIAISFPLCAQAATLPTKSFQSGSMHVDQYGSGNPTLLLIPGLTDSAAVWSQTVDHYAPTHTIYVLTLPGFGGQPPVAARMLDKVDADIAALLPRLNKPVVIGHSMGGLLAIRIAEEHSALIKAAIAVDGLPVFPGMDKLSAADRAKIAEQMAAPMRHATKAQFAKGERMTIPYLTKAQNVDAVTGFGEAADPAATAEYTAEDTESDLRPALSKVTVPLLEIMPFDAALDPYNPYLATKTLDQKRAYYQSLFANDKTAQVVAIEDARHFVMIDQPQKFYAAVDAFLAGLR